MTRLITAAYGTARNVTLTTNGFNGSESSISNGFSNIDNIIGSAQSDTLIGLSATSSWKFEVGSLKLEVGSNTLEHHEF